MLRQQQQSLRAGILWVGLCSTFPAKCFNMPSTG